MTYIISRLHTLIVKISNCLDNRHIYSIKISTSLFLEIYVLILGIDILNELDKNIKVLICYVKMALKL